MDTELKLKLKSETATETEGTEKYISYLRNNLMLTSERRQELERDESNLDRLNNETSLRNSILESVINGFKDIFEMLESRPEKGIEEKIIEKFREVSEKMGYCGMNHQVEIKNKEKAINEENKRISELSLRVTRKEIILEENQEEEKKRQEEARRCKARFLRVLNSEID